MREPLRRRARGVPLAPLGRPRGWSSALLLRLMAVGARSARASRARARASPASASRALRGALCARMARRTVMCAAVCHCSPHHTATAPFYPVSEHARALGADFRRDGARPARQAAQAGALCCAVGRGQASEWRRCSPTCSSIADGPAARSCRCSTPRCASSRCWRCLRSMLGGLSRRSRSCCAVRGCCTGSTRRPTSLFRQIASRPSHDSCQSSCSSTLRPGGRRPGRQRAIRTQRACSSSGLDRQLAPCCSSKRLPAARRSRRRSMERILTETRRRAAVHRGADQGVARDQRGARRCRSPHGVARRAAAASTSRRRCRTR